MNPSPLESPAPPAPVVVGKGGSDDVSVVARRVGEKRRGVAWISSEALRRCNRLTRLWLLYLPLPNQSVVA